MDKKDIIKIVGFTTVLVGLIFVGRYLIQNRKRKVVTTSKGDLMIPEEVGLIIDAITRPTGQQSSSASPSQQTNTAQIVAQLDANNNGLIDSTEGGVTTNSAGEVVSGVPTMEYLQQQLVNM
jgi:hypothetical protein